jgi:hypothetical protein
VKTIGVAAFELPIGFGKDKIGIFFSPIKKALRGTSMHIVFG